MNKVIVAFAVALFAGLLGFAGATSASTLTLSFTGTEGGSGETVKGKVVAGGTFTDNSVPAIGFYDVSYDTATYTFQVGSGPVFTGTTALARTLSSPMPGGAQVAQANFYIGPLFGPSDIYLYLWWDPTSQPVSLATFPTNETAAEAYFGVALVSTATAWFSPTQVYNFTVNTFSISVAQTPLPAAAWFLLTALGGMGFAGWRQRRLASAHA